MALSEAAQEKSPPETGKSDKKEKPLTKVIVRRLPPAMTKEEFLTQVSPVPDHDYIYGVRGDMAHGENAFARFYMNFMNTEDVYMFKEKFDNYVFVDGKGHEYPAVVEYSSFQKVPKRRKGRPDPKINTIETDPIYQEFLESLKEQPNQEEKPEYSYQPSTENKNDITTPLLDYLKQRKQDRMRMREEKREERRKKEIERKKVREDDRRRRTEEKVTVKTVKTGVLKEAESKPEKKDEVEVEKLEKTEKPEKPAAQKPKEKKYEERKPAKKYPAKYEEKREFNKSRNYREHQKEKFEEKKEQKKVKKYSERREERKNEASKAEVKKETVAKMDEKVEDRAEASKSAENSDDNEHKSKNKENDPRMQRRIRNKDRPTMAIYKPGMLRKKSVDNDKDVEKDVNELEKPAETETAE